MRLSALSQGRSLWGNHSTEGSWVITDAGFQTDPIIRETLWHSHIPHILHTQSYNRLSTCMMRQRGRNPKVALFFCFTTNTLEQDEGEELHLAHMHFKRDPLCKFEAVREKRTDEELWNKVLEGAHRTGTREGGTTTFLLQGEKRQHSVGEEERVDSNWITGYKHTHTKKKDKKTRWQEWTWEHSTKHGQKTRQHYWRKFNKGLKNMWS